MPPYNRIHVVHTTVADFRGVFVKDFVVFVRGGEVLLNKCKESFTDVSLDVFPEAGVEPYHLKLHRRCTAVFTFKCSVIYDQM